MVKSLAAYSEKSCTLKFQGNSSFLSDKSQLANGIDVLGELEKLGAVVAYGRNQASSRENTKNVLFLLRSNISKTTQVKILVKLGQAKKGRFFYVSMTHQFLSKI